MHFPLSDWIDSHAGCRYNLAKSGMAGVVRLPRPSPARVAGRDPEEWTEELRVALSDYLRVDPRRVFLTHGATEANSWVVFFSRAHARSVRRQCRVRWPEYPPLVEVARRAGFEPVETPGPVPFALLSLPRNPEGVGWTSAQLAEWAEGAETLLVDETFREFSGRPSRAEAGTPGVWTTGSFTKFFGADSVRVGYAVAPPEAAADFARFHGVVADDVPPYSAALAVELLRRRTPIARRVRELFDRNRTALRRVLPAVPSLDGSVYFDRPPDRDGAALAARCLEASVLVCPGSFFGAEDGVRICLTRPSFPRDLAAYLAVRGGTDRRPARRTTSGVGSGAARSRPSGGAQARAGP